MQRARLRCLPSLPHHLCRLHKRRLHQPCQSFNSLLFLALQRQHYPVMPAPSPLLAQGKQGRSEGGLPWLSHRKRVGRKQAHRGQTHRALQLVLSRPPLPAPLLHPRQQTFQLSLHLRLSQGREVDPRAPKTSPSRGLSGRLPLLQPLRLPLLRPRVLAALLGARQHGVSPVGCFLTGPAACRGY